MDLIKTTINSKKIVIIYFYNNECIKTCNILENLDQNKQNVLIEKLNIEDNKNKNIIDRLDVKCFPSFFIYKNGVLIDEIIGTLDKIENILNLYINI